MAAGHSRFDFGDDRRGRRVFGLEICGFQRRERLRKDETSFILPRGSTAAWENEAKRNGEMKTKIQLTLLIGLIAALVFRNVAQAKPREIKTDAAQRAQLDKFFSNFAEASLKPFQKNKVSDQILIDFAINYIFENKPQVTKKSRVSAEEVAASAAYFFGRKIKKHQSIPDHAYKNGSYDGGDSTLERETQVFARIKKLVYLSDNEYLASVENYVGRPNGKDEDKPRLDKKVSATIRQVRTKNKSRYILTSYKIVWKWQFSD